jgi:hypothetical protein
MAITTQAVVLLVDGSRTGGKVCQVNAINIQGMAGRAGQQHLPVARYDQKSSSENTDVRVEVCSVCQVRRCGAMLGQT